MLLIWEEGLCWEYTEGESDRSEEDFLVGVAGIIGSVGVEEVGLMGVVLDGGKVGEGRSVRMTGVIGR